MRALLLLVFAIALPSPARALPPERAQKLVADARVLLGVPYQLGGRLRAKGGGVEGIDCQGLVFFALQSTSTCGWKSWSVMPTVSIAARELGAPVPLGRKGDMTVATAELDVAKLEPGDVIHFVGFDENPAERAIDVLDGKPVWVWHLALASGGGRFIAGDPYAGAVFEEDLLAYLREHAEDFAGVLVTRMADGPRAGRCRRHAPMIAPTIMERR